MPLSNPSSFTVTSTASSASNVINVAASTTNVLVLAVNSFRKGVTFWNNSTANLFIETGAAATLTSYTVKINPGGYYELPFGYTGVVNAIWDGTNGTALVREFT